MNNRRLLGILGSAILFIGVFMPIVKVPIVGDINYFQNGRGDGVIVLALAVISLALVLLRWYRELWITALGSAVIDSGVLQTSLYNRFNCSGAGPCSLSGSRC